MLSACVLTPKCKHPTETRKILLCYAIGIKIHVENNDAIGMTSVFLTLTAKHMQAEG